MVRRPHPHRPPRPGWVRGRSTGADRGAGRRRLQRALVFAMQEPDGYRAPNDWVLRSCAESGGRLVPLARIDPKAPMPWTRRGAAWRPVPGASSCIRAATASRFRIPSSRSSSRWPASTGCRALPRRPRDPGPRRADRGPRDRASGRAADPRARRRQRPRAAGPHVGGLPNILFDTSWWHVSDLLALFAVVPPGQILYASDMPYGGPRYPALLMLRCARAVGLTPEQVAMIAGGQIERVLAGEDLLDLGPAAGAGTSARACSASSGSSATWPPLSGDVPAGRSDAGLRVGAPGLPGTDGAQHRVVLQEMDRFLAVSQQRMADGIIRSGASILRSWRWSSQAPLRLSHCPDSCQCPNCGV